jgi:hypothetical protein
METKTAVESSESKVESARKPRTEADHLRMAAERRAQRGEPVTALLFRNEAFRLENEETQSPLLAIPRNR